MSASGGKPIAARSVLPGCRWDGGENHSVPMRTFGVWIGGGQCGILVVWAAAGRFPAVGRICCRSRANAARKGREGTGWTAVAIVSSFNVGRLHAKSSGVYERCPSFGMWRTSFYRISIAHILVAT